MEWSQLVLILGIVFLAQLVGGFVVAAWRDLQARRAPARIRAGRRVGVPVMALTDRPRRGRAFRDGDDMRVTGRSLCLVVDRSVAATAAVRRDQYDSDWVEVAELRGFADEVGDAVFVGPAQEWAPAFEALLEAPAARAGLGRRVRSVTPKAAVLCGLVALLLAAAFQVLWWTGHDERATVTHVEVDEEGFAACSVRWDGASGQEGATVDCYEPFPAVGSEVTVRALAWPFEGEAMDDEGSYEGLTTVTGGAALVLLVGGPVTGLLRALRPAWRLTALPPVAPAGALGPAGATPDAIAGGRKGQGAAPDVAGDLEALPLRDLARRVSVVEGWADEVHPAPVLGPWATFRRTAVSPVWWALVPIAAFLLLAENIPEVGVVALGAVAAVIVLRGAVRGVRALWFMGGAGRQPVTSEWDYVVVRGIENEWYLLLVLGQTPHWSVLLPQGRHPRQQGRCGVRGHLVDGGAIQLVIDGETWVPVGAVLRETEEGRAVLRADLTDRLRHAAMGGRHGVAPGAA